MVLPLVMTLNTITLPKMYDSDNYRTIVIWYKISVQIWYGTVDNSVDMVYQLYHLVVCKYLPCPYGLDLVKFVQTQALLEFYSSNPNMF